MELSRNDLAFWIIQLKRLRQGVFICTFHKNYCHATRSAKVPRVIFRNDLFYLPVLVQFLISPMDHELEAIKLPELKAVMVDAAILNILYRKI